LVAARMTALSPGQSPPPVRMPIVGLRGGMAKISAVNTPRFVTRDAKAGNGC